MLGASRYSGMRIDTSISSRKRWPGKEGIVTGADLNSLVPKKQVKVHVVR